MKQQQQHQQQGERDRSLEKTKAVDDKCQKGDFNSSSTADHGQLATNGVNHMVLQETDTPPPPQFRSCCGRRASSGKVKRRKEKAEATATDDEIGCQLEFVKLEDRSAVDALPQDVASIGSFQSTITNTSTSSSALLDPLSPGLVLILAHSISLLYFCFLFLSRSTFLSL